MRVVNQSSPSTNHKSIGISAGLYKFVVECEIEQFRDVEGSSLAFIDMKDYIIDGTSVVGIPRLRNRNSIEIFNLVSSLVEGLNYPIRG